MEVREARADEFGEVARQYALAAEEGWIAGEPPIDVAERAERFRAQNESGTATTFVVEDHGSLIGHAGLHAVGPKGVYTFGMAVLPEARGRGAGRLLLEHLVDAAAARGGHKIELEVWVDNARAIALYASMGFEVEGLKRNHYRRKDGSLRSALLMARQLPE